ncbi:CRISPR-associated endonuclease Cas2 [Companilactobacillus keshanensis]|uniref:CRISPR-associated endoribonuclease Cas2 n=1 Tax=Companilactobacillus keshanensis TaxID=2486003 RepID=A0ABW4BVS3_9LACO|nr:CRISPR-associated endonuclease Cas2 [Companilactobacillus keshanensis]
MRLMVMFDLPTLTASDRRNYRQFRKNLINEGFIMMQESIYTCVIIDKQAARLLDNRITMYAPTKGIIQSIIITEKQFEAIRFIAGDKNDEPENKFDRIVVI